jgi:hypothetical protein
MVISAVQEGSPHDEQQVGKDRANQGQLNNHVLLVNDSLKAEEHLDDIPEGCVDQSANDGVRRCCNVFSRLPDKPGHRQDRKEVQQEPSFSRIDFWTPGSDINAERNEKEH